MCGIVGLYAKNDSIRQSLGKHLSAMLVQMGERGPDSAGVAIYNDAQRDVKVTVQHDNASTLEAVCDAVTAHYGEAIVRSRGTHRVFELNGDATAASDWIREQFADVRIMSAGSRIEIYKEKGHPEQFVADYALDDVTGSHALGHTRMATESAITTSHSHPFSTGQDLCLVHNGSLSNHNRLRDVLREEGIRFETDNDSEVAAGFLASRIARGESLQSALNAALKELDGFYTFAIGTHDGFAVLRDPIACKPAVLAETDDWVAMSSEYRAIAQLPGATHATVWEPEPATLYTWEAGHPPPVKAA